MKKKFNHYAKTADGKDRAYADLKTLDTLWINTGTLCNLECKNCYIESSPCNDSLIYISYDEVCSYLNEIQQENLKTRKIAFTGGEPFMNKDIVKILEECLSRGFEVIVLTNAMRPMMRFEAELKAINETYDDLLTVRVSCDHFRPEMHEMERGKGTWAKTLQGLQFLSGNKFKIDIAGRTRWGEADQDLRAGYAALFKQHNIDVDAYDPAALVLFPEMDDQQDVPEISTECWDILGKTPDDVMCSNSRMIVKRKGADKPSVIACTLLPYEKEFEFGSTLKNSEKRTYLNHPHCSKFCVLGGGACSA